MIKQSWVVSDNERKRIISLHENATKKQYLITEQSDSNFTINFGDTFKSGEYMLSPEFQSEVSERVQEIVKFIKGKNLKNVKIIITPGESQVTNQQGFEVVGSLAKKRAEVLKDYLEKLLPKLLQFVPSFEIQEPVIGKTPYTKGQDKDSPSYKREQFVNVTVDTSAAENSPRESSLGEPIYLNNRLIALLDVPFRKSDSDSSSGQLDTTKIDFSFNVVKPDTQPPQIIEKYKIPWQWWNKTIGPTNTITQENYDFIRSNFTKL